MRALSCYSVDWLLLVCLHTSFTGVDVIGLNPQCPHTCVGDKTGEIIDIENIDHSSHSLSQHEIIHNMRTYVRGMKKNHLVLLQRTMENFAQNDRTAEPKPEMAANAMHALGKIER